MHAAMSCPPIVNNLSPILESVRYQNLHALPSSCQMRNPPSLPSLTVASMLHSTGGIFILSPLSCVGFGQQIISSRAASAFSSSSVDSADVYSVVAFDAATTAFTAEKESVSEFG